MGNSFSSPSTKGRSSTILIIKASVHHSTSIIMKVMLMLAVLAVSIGSLVALPKCSKPCRSEHPPSDCPFYCVKFQQQEDKIRDVVRDLPMTVMCSQEDMQKQMGKEYSVTDTSSVTGDEY